jgi:hypothetical protein
MRLRVCSSAAVVLLVAGLGLGSPAAAKKCGFESTLSGPGIAGRGVDLPCTNAVATRAPAGSGVHGLSGVPAHHGDRYVITYPYTTRTAAPRKFVMYIYPHASGGMVVHIPTGQNAFNLFPIKAPITYKIDGSRERAFHKIYFPRKVANLLPEPAPEVVPAAVTRATTRASNSTQESDDPAWLYATGVAALLAICALAWRRSQRRERTIR